MVKELLGSIVCFLLGAVFIILYLTALPNFLEFNQVFNILFFAVPTTFIVLGMIFALRS
jgi:ribose/xylose/arabinose/galactoside ABC-type transport system permease subunit